MTLPHRSDKLPIVGEPVRLALPPIGWRTWRLLEEIARQWSDKSRDGYVHQPEDVARTMLEMGVWDGAQRHLGKARVDEITHEAEAGLFRLGDAPDA